MNAITLLPNRICSIAAGVLGIVVFGIAPLQAQEYPTRPIRIIVGSPPGATVDAVARAVAPRLQANLAQSVSIENRSGGAGSASMAAAAQAMGDGHTLLVAPDLNSADLVHVAVLGKGTYVWVTNAASSMQTANDVVNAAKRRPGAVRYASTGVASQTHIAMDSLVDTFGVPLTHVPFDGASEAISNLMGGQVDTALLPSASALPQIRAGKLRALAVTADTRSQLLQDVPTVSEALGKPYSFDIRYSLYAPRTTPSSVIKKLNEQSHQAIQDPGVRQQLVAAGLDGRVGSTGDPGPGTSCASGETYCECQRRCTARFIRCPTACMTKPGSLKP